MLDGGSLSITAINQPAHYSPVLRARRVLLSGFKAQRQVGPAGLR